MTTVPAALPVALPRLIQAVLEIALAGRIAGKDLNRRCGFGPRGLEGYLQYLAHDGVLRGWRGSYGGGYGLGREPTRISVGDIARSARRYSLEISGTKSWLEGDVWPVPGTIGCSVVRPALEALDRKIMAELDALTIADLMRPIVEQGGGI